MIYYSFSVHDYQLYSCSYLLRLINRNYIRFPFQFTFGRYDWSQLFVNLKIRRQTCGRIGLTGSDVTYYQTHESVYHCMPNCPCGRFHIFVIKPFALQSWCIVSKYFGFQLWWLGYVKALISIFRDVSKTVMIRYLL